MYKPKKGDIVKILWHDAWGSSKWAEPLQTTGPAPVEVIGWVLKNDKEGILLAAVKSIDDELVSNRFFVPKGMVVKVQRLGK